MALSKALLPEFDHEMANTRKTLERVPDDKFDWKPHEKSMSLGNLATHLSNIPMWAVYAISQTSIDLAPEGEPPMKVEPATSRQEVLDRFDESVKSAREAIEGATDEQLFVDWSLLNGGQTILSMPRIAVLRGFVMNHNIHHRAQLGVYLRLNDVAVPSIYGPSADESGM
ncbi:MAG TPA: DinB family protein [Pyrinomonadaceae bacterium]|jgi:uncharacterized damage-inducible protein DinB